jgi:hypothetical protein
MVTEIRNGKWILLIEFMVVKWIEVTNEALLAAIYLVASKLPGTNTI